ncbi:MAG: cysteine desulfurase [Chloroflexi bacterium]|nr:cysteine desulfurase [Chloroflexota bacterium]MCC6891212.1 cysteine desulfurase [Anaerolineae bacterium]
MASRRRIYLDYSATTPTDPRVVESMLPYFSTEYGDPNAPHKQGRAAHSAVENARETIARILNCQPAEIYFTSGASASNNIVLRAAAWSAHQKGQSSHIITSAVEHSAVLRTAEQLGQVMGFDYSLLPVDHKAAVSAANLASLLRDDTALVSVMLVNNEVGTIQPIPELSAAAHRRGIPFHTDAVQGAGQLSLDVQALGVDFLSLSAHKFYGPKGIGLLFARSGIDLGMTQANIEPSLNVPFIVGMAKALELAYNQLDSRVNHFSCLRDQLIDTILSRIPDVHLTGDPVNRLPSNASFVFEGLDGNALVTHLDMRGIAASSASACKTGNPEPSSVLLAMGYSPKDALGSLRLTVGLHTTSDEITDTVDVLCEVVEKLRKLNREMAL